MLLFTIIALLQTEVMKTPDWSALADKGIWGALVGVLAASLVGWSVFYLANKNAYKTLSDELSRSSIRTDSLLSTVRHNSEIMIQIITDHTAAMTKLSSAVDNVARVVDECPKKNSEKK
ncbi:MAG: hypothetical protein WC998_00500 [Candidatus Paceibacterota bacterium]|jgi:hypothetical protein